MNLLPQVFIVVICMSVFQYLLNAEVLWKFFNPIWGQFCLPRVFLILLLVIIFLVGIVLSFSEFTEGWSYLWVGTTTHAHCGGVVVLLWGPSEGLLEVRHCIATVIHCVILVFVRQFLTRNFLLIFFLILIKRLLRHAPLLCIILLVFHLMLRAVFLLTVYWVLVVYLLLIICGLIIIVKVLRMFIWDNGSCLIILHLTVIVIHILPFFIVDGLHIILMLLLLLALLVF